MLDLRCLHYHRVFNGKLSKCCKGVQQCKLHSRTDGQRTHLRSLITSSGTTLERVAIRLMYEKNCYFETACIAKVLSLDVGG